MKYRFGGHGFFAAGRPLAAGLLASAALHLGACTTASIDDVAPTTSTTATKSTAATAPQPTPRPDESAVAGRASGPAGENVAAADPAAGPRTTGQYPNLNVTPGTAAEQLTPEEKAALLSELRAKQADVAAAAAKARPADEVEALRALGARHAEDALKDIQKKSQ